MPKTWADRAIATLVGGSGGLHPKHVSAGYYYRIPVPINLIGHPRRPGAYRGQVMVGLGKEGNTMKKLALLLCAVTPFAIVPLFAAEGRMTADERAYLLDQLETSKKNMLASIQGVTAEQWKFKPAPAVWSVQEVAEHIILAEDYIFGGSQQILKIPAVDRPASSNAEVDKKIVAGVQDRSKKATAPEPLVPGAKFATPDDAIREFTARRDNTIAYVKTTNDELRVHVGPGPAGPMDAYQALLLLASHSARHTAQIREVEANTGYPRKSGSGL